MTEAVVCPSPLPARSKRNGSHRCKPLNVWLRGQDLVVICRESRSSNSRTSANDPLQTFARPETETPAARAGAGQGITRLAQLNG